MTKQNKYEGMEAIQSPSLKACATSCASPGTLTSVGDDVMEREIRCSCIMDIPDGDLVAYKQFWSVPEQSQFFSCTDPCIWTKLCTLEDENPALREIEDELFLCSGDYLYRPDMPISGNQMDPDTDGKVDCEDPNCTRMLHCQPEICDGTEDIGNTDIDEGFECRPKRKQRAAKQDRLTADQLAELLAIDKRIGLRGQLQRFIHALNSGGQALEASAEDIAINYHCDWWEVERQRQALVFWHKGIGRALGYSSFQKYLASIPEVPVEIRRSSGKFNRLVLVEGRLGLKKLCQLAGVLCHCSDHQDPDTSARWMRCQEGRRYKNKSAKTVLRNIFADSEVGLNLFEGVCLYMQFPRVLCEEFAMVCVGGPRVGSHPSDTTKLFIWRQGPEVGWTFYATQKLNQGVASKLILL